MFDVGRAERCLDVHRRHKSSIQYAEERVGGLSRPGKMPWYSYSIPNWKCRVGQNLAKVPGSVCEGCYAGKGRYSFHNVQHAMATRLLIIEHDLEQWAATMVWVLGKKSRGEYKHFRWHDSGDLQGQDHLDAIIWIARQLPHIEFWLPTKEYGLIYGYDNILDVRATKNLCVRVSAAMVGQVMHDGVFPTSSVDGNEGFTCPSNQQGNKCLDCTACWDSEVVNVDYPLH